MNTVFLSASFPTPERVDESGLFHAADIGAAAASVIEATLRSGANLIFGGHPTITPLVLHIASILNAGAQVTIFQSEFFRKQITEEVFRLSELEGSELVFVPAGEGLEDSLELLRNAMFEAPIEMAFFVGGMSGVHDEFQILADKLETTCITFEAPGGMAAKIGAELPLNNAESKYTNLKGRAYASLVLKEILRHNIGTLKDSGEL